MRALGSLLAFGVAWLSASAGARLWQAEGGGGPWSITGEVGPGRDLRFEVRAGDQAAWDVAHHHPAERAEIASVTHKEPVDADIWLAFDLSVEPGPKVTSRWLVIGQLHATEDAGTMPVSPAWAQELDAGDVFRIVVRTSTEASMRTNPAAIVLYADPTFRRGQTNRFVYQLRYSQTAGRLRAWREGRLVADYSGPLGYPTSRGPYFKFGIYREPAPETVAVHYGGLRFGGPELQPR